MSTSSERATGEDGRLRLRGSCPQSVDDVEHAPILSASSLAFFVTKCEFQIKMGSREQLRELFGRTLAYSIVTKCGNQTKTIKVRVSVNQNGELRKTS